MLNTSKPGWGCPSAAALLLALSSLASCKGTARSLEASGEAGTSGSAASSEAPDAEIPYLDIRCDRERGLGFCTEPHTLPGKVGAPLLQRVFPSPHFIRTLTVDEEGRVWFETQIFVRGPGLETELAGGIQSGSMKRVRELVEDAVRGPVISVDHFGPQPIAHSAPPSHYVHLHGSKHLLQMHVSSPRVGTSYQRRRPSALALRRLIDDVNTLALKVPPPASSHGAAPGKEPR